MTTPAYGHAPRNQRYRENGAYYDRMFEAATPKKIEGYTYLDYGKCAPGCYLERTRYWLDRWLAP